MKNPKKKGTAMIYLGLLLIAAALLLTTYNLYDGLRAGEEARRALEELSEAGNISGEGDVPDYIQNPDMEMPVKTVDGIDYVGVLEIPALELTLPVISQWSYSALTTAPCRYSGSAYLNNLVLCGHNYSSHFGSLKELREGDAVIFTDMDGNVFTYETALLETLSPTDVEEMKSGGWDLTLFTCNAAGSYRMTVRCEQQSAFTRREMDGNTMDDAGEH